MKVVIYISYEQIGFFIGLGKLLLERHEVLFLAEDRDVDSFIKRHIPDAVTRVNEKELSELSPDIISDARKLEEKYQIRISALIAEDRALGRGYLFNVDRYPGRKKSWWANERKISTVISHFQQVEEMLESYRADCLICWRNNPVLFQVAKSRDIPSFSLAPVKLGERFIWSDNPYLTSKELRNRIQDHLKETISELPEVKDYQQEALSKARIDRIKYSFREMCHDLAKQIATELYKLVRGTRKPDSYFFLGWVPSIARKPLTHRYLTKYGVTPEDLRDARVCFIPLHLEPEITLLSVSPEFNNSMEMIAWISKSAPADMIIVLKENPVSFGVRSKWYYNQLRQIGNVVWAKPEINSWEWLKVARVAATITGTAGTEAVMFKRPVLSFGKHQAINLLPTVRFANNFESVGSGLDDLLAIASDDSTLELSRRAFFQAQIDCSFELKGFSNTFKTTDPQKELALIGQAALLPCFEFHHSG